MLKRLICMALALAMCFSLLALTGCDDKKPVNNNANQNGQTSIGTEDEFFMDMPSELKGTTVKFATWIDHSQTDTGAVLAGFEQATGMKYEMVSINQSDYFVKLASLIAADQSPDVVVDNWEFPRSLNCLMPLTVEETGLDVTDPFWDQHLVKNFTVGKYCYLVNGARSSWNMGGGVTYFNKSVFEDNGIKTPTEYVEEDNWNLNTLYTMMTQIKKSCGFSNPGTAIEVDNFVTMFGAYMVTWDYENQKFVNTLNSDKMNAALKYLLEAKDAGLVKLGYSSGIGDFATGKGALEINGSYGLRNKPGWFYEMDLDDLGVTVLPKINASDADYPYTGQLRAYGICKGSKNPKGAAYFLRYFLNEAYYDMNAIFKNDECKDLYLQIREKGINSDDCYGAIIHKYVNQASKNHLQDVLDGTEAQLNVNLASITAAIDGNVTRANASIDAFVKEQQ